MTSIRMITDRIVLFFRRLKYRIKRLRFKIYDIMHYEYVKPRTKPIPLPVATLEITEEGQIKISGKWKSVHIILNGHALFMGGHTELHGCIIENGIIELAPFDAVIEDSHIVQKDRPAKEQSAVEILNELEDPDTDEIFDFDKLRREQAEDIEDLDGFENDIDKMQK